MSHGPADPTDLIEANSEQSYETTSATSVNTTLTPVANLLDLGALAVEHPPRDEPA